MTIMVCEYPRRRAFLEAGVATAASILLPNALAHEYFTPRFTLIHPWTRASAPGATFAKICMTFDEVRESDRLIGARTVLAGDAEMGIGNEDGRRLDIAVPKDIKTEFSEEGTHLRLVRLKAPLAIGREYPITLVFAGSGELKASFLVDYEAKA